MMLASYLIKGRQRIYANHIPGGLGGSSGSGSGLGGLTSGSGSGLSGLGESIQNELARIVLHCNGYKHYRQ